MIINELLVKSGATINGAQDYTATANGAINKGDVVGFTVNAGTFTSWGFPFNVSNHDNGAKQLPEGNYAIYNDSGTIKLINANAPSFTVVQTYTPANTPTSFFFRNNYFGWGDGTKAYLYNVNAPTVCIREITMSDDVRVCDVAYDGSVMYVLRDGDPNLYVYDVATGDELGECYYTDNYTDHIFVHPTDPKRIAWDYDGTHHAVHTWQFSSTWERQSQNSTDDNAYLNGKDVRFVSFDGNYMYVVKEETTLYKLDLTNAMVDEYTLSGIYEPCAVGSSKWYARGGSASSNWYTITDNGDEFVKSTTPFTIGYNPSIYEDYETCFTINSSAERFWASSGNCKQASVSTTATPCNNTLSGYSSYGYAPTAVESGASATFKSILR